MVGTDEAANVGVAADQRHLGDHALHPAVDCAHDENMAAAVAGPPDADALRVRFCQRLGVSDRVAVVADLLPGVDLLARSTITGTKVAVVKDDRGKSGRCENLCEAIEIHLFHRREAVRHDDGRHLSLPPIWHVVPAAEGYAVLGIERDILAH